LAPENVFESHRVLHGWHKLRTHVKDGIPLVIIRVDDLLSKYELVWTIDDRPILKDGAGSQKDEQQNEGAQDVILKRSSRIGPENNILHGAKHNRPQM